MRDKRGYETIYLMHWFREGTRHRSRILYMFRTPGGVRVGRVALEPETIRQIEAQHPDIAFDWHAVRETQQVIEPSPDFRRRRPRRDQEEAGGAPDDVEPAVAPPAAHVEQPEPEPEPESATAAPASPPRVQVPAALEGNTPDEQIAFLLHWHPIICERLALRTADPERRTALLALAERLNPSAWMDADQITSGLQQAAEALERLSRVMARRRRRARRSSGASRVPTAAGDGGSDGGAES
jgi:hypothetical protein